MKKVFAVLAAACLFLGFCRTPLAAQTRKAFPEDNGKALVNPGMGWMLYYYSNILDTYGSRLEPSDVVADFPGMSTVFLRLPWSFLEPEKDRFNWEIIDTPAQRWLEKGYQVAFCITATENWTRQGTPQWVFDEGAKYYEVGGFTEVDYDDPIFLAAVEHMVEKMAARYDGDPAVAFFAIGAYGMWGEGHTVRTTPNHGHSWGFETQKKYIDIYTRHFKKTQLCISDDYPGHSDRRARFPITDYAKSKGVTIKDDS
ncbi:MAG: beta-galactosidase, partial [Bacteroidales bacterium]|nr:beta-galactosidase [Bacteroidales bacterium]